MYRTLIAQTLHYYARPHDEIRRTPLGGPMAWSGATLAEHPERWREDLGGEDLLEIERALARTRRLGRPIETLRRRDFEAPRLASRVAGWRREIEDGRGFVVVSGVPVDRWDPSDVELFTWCFAHLLGVPGAQNPEGHLLGHVHDTGADPAARDVRQYRTRSHIPFHCDAADVVGLLCLETAKEGGTSKIASSVAIHDALLRRRPDLVARLYEPFEMDTKGEGGVDHFPITPCRHWKGRLRTFWHAEYFRTAWRFEDVPPPTDRDREVLDLFDALADELTLDMELRPGDLQLVSNHGLVHSRTDYVDHDDPREKRHLLRLWLSLERRSPWRERASALRELGRLVRTLAGRKLARRLHGPSRLRA